jgi:hypothetical protein
LSSIYVNYSCGTSTRPPASVVLSLRFTFEVLMRTKRTLLCFIALVTLLVPARINAQQSHYDFIISGARVVDGTGAPWFVADIGITGDRISAIGDLHNATAKKRIDAAGLVASPGFIDVQGQSEFNVLVDNRAASKITQGVTTEITAKVPPLRRSTIACLRILKTMPRSMALSWIGAHLMSISGVLTGSGRRST